MNVPPSCNWSFDPFKEIIRILLSFYFSEYLNIAFKGFFFKQRNEQTIWRYLSHSVLSSRGAMGARGILLDSDSFKLQQ